MERGRDGAPIDERNVELFTTSGGQASEIKGGFRQGDLRDSRVTRESNLLVHGGGTERAGAVTLASSVRCRMVLDGQGIG